MRLPQQAAQPGDVHENPITGERFVYVETADSTDGARFVFDVHLRPGGRVPTPHVHVGQDETFQVLHGSAGFRLGLRTFRHRGEGFEVFGPAGRTHRFWNDHDDETVVRVEARPAKQLEAFFEVYCDLAQRGEATRLGTPPALTAGELALAHDTYLGFVPIALQRWAIRALLAVRGARAR